MRHTSKALGRVICTALIFCTLLLMAPTALAAEGDIGVDGDFEWRELADGTVAIISYNGSGGDVTIPATLSSKAVTMIEDWSFNTKGLNSLTIPSGVTFIGYASFSNNNLTNLTIPNTVSTIKDGAFYNNKITSITIPSSVTTICDRAFAYNNISQVTLESDITSLFGTDFDDQTVNGQAVTEWYDNTGTSVNIYSTRSGAVTYYAKFTADVDFQENGGSTVADITNQPGFTLVAKPEDPTKERYTFGGWYTDNDTFESAWNFDTDTLTQDAVLYAKWNAIRVNSVTLNSTSEDILLGGETTLTATVLPENATYPEVTWTSSDESVVTVDADGNITAAGAGNAVITATADGMSVTCNVTVNLIAVTSVTLSEMNADILLGDKMTLTATVLPANATYPEVTWTSSNESVATVDENGKISGVSLGKAVITATADGKSAQCNVTVKPIRVTSIALDKDKADIIVGDEMTLTATVLPADATYPEVTWTSSNESVATVDENGKISAVSLGNAVITATADGMSATCDVTVTPIEVTSVTLSQDKADLKVDDELTLTATVLPADATYPEVIWTTGNENVATVDTNGKVKAVGVGSAVITATADGKSAGCRISVASGETTKPDAPKGSIRGRLADAKGEPLAGYMVVLHSDPITAMTNSNGEFVFENVPLTSHTLLIQETDGMEIGRYGLAFTQSDTASYTKDEENLDITSTVNTVAIDVLIHVSEDGKTTSMDKVTIIVNPKTGEDSMLWVWVLCIAAIVMGSIYGYCLLKNKFR